MTIWLFRCVDCKGTSFHARANGYECMDCASLRQEMVKQEIE